MNLYTELSKTNADLTANADIKGMLDKERKTNKYSSEIEKQFCEQPMEGPVWMAFSTREEGGKTVIKSTEVVAVTRTSATWADVQEGIDGFLVNRALELAKKNTENDLPYNFAFAPLDVKPTKFDTVTKVVHTHHLKNEIVYGFQGDNALNTGIIYLPYIEFEGTDGGVLGYRYAVCDDLEGTESYYSYEKL